MHKLNSGNTILDRTRTIVTRFATGGHLTFEPSSDEDRPRRVSEFNHLLDLVVNYLEVQREPKE